MDGHDQPECSVSTEVSVPQDDVQVLSIRQDDTTAQLRAEICSKRRACSAIRSSEASPNYTAEVGSKTPNVHRSLGRAEFGCLATRHY